MKKLGLGKKNLILGTVALILAGTTVVTATESWIEDVSQVEFSSTDGQQTPLHVGSKVLKSDALIQRDDQNTTISIADYFYESGDMHLSPCYSDGVNFFFPVTQGGANDKFRQGTKDDVNVNYISATFRVKSVEENTVFWFEKTSPETELITFTDSEDEATDYKQYLRVALTVDGVTNVYAYNSSGEFYSVSSISDFAAASQTGRALENYIYYPETDFTEDEDSTSPVDHHKADVNVDDKPNQGSGDNLNGNTLFSLNKYENKADTKEVTVKIWLEYNSSISDVKVSSINLNLVSSLAKSRRIWVRDETVWQKTYANAKWLTTTVNVDGTDYTPTLFWAIKDDITNENKHWPLTKYGSTNFYYADIPAVYNNKDVVLLRTKNGWNTGNYHETLGISYWDKWETTFPDTFHSETFTVYSTDFGTWNGDVHTVYYINSAFDIQSRSSGESVDYTVPYDYMWDSTTEHGTGINDKVVKNADWPGKKMHALLHPDLMKSGNYTFTIPTYAFHFNSDYDRIIFNDGHLEEGKNNEYQTQDLWVTSSEFGKTFDMSTLTWFNTSPGSSDWKTKIPTYSSDNTYLYGNFSTDNRWRKTRFAWGGEYGSTDGNAFNTTSTNHMLCKIYNKSGDASSDYEFVVYYNDTCYKTFSTNVNLYAGDTGITLYPEGGNNTYNVYAKELEPKTVYRFYLDNASNNSVTLKMYKGEN